MNNNLEIEYKILLSEEQFNELSKSYPNLTFIKQTNTYYDTDSFTLRKQGCGMRIRERENKFLFTCKVPTRQGHMEHEIFVKENSVEALNIPEIQTLIQSLGVISPVHPIATCTTYRAIVKLEKAELCFDINDYNGIRDYEVEYECCEIHNGIEEFNKILNSIGLHYTKNCKSKIARTMESQ